MTHGILMNFQYFDAFEMGFYCLLESDPWKIDEHRRFPRPVPAGVPSLQTGPRICGLCRRVVQWHDRHAGLPRVLAVNVRVAWDKIGAIQGTKWALFCYPVAQGCSAKIRRYG